MRSSFCSEFRKSLTFFAGWSKVMQTFCQLSSFSRLKSLVKVKTTSANSRLPPHLYLYSSKYNIRFFPALKMHWLLKMLNLNLVQMEKLMIWFSFLSRVTVQLGLLLPPAKGLNFRTGIAATAKARVRVTKTRTIVGRLVGALTVYSGPTCLSYLFAPYSFSGNQRLDLVLYSTLLSWFGLNGKAKLTLGFVTFLQGTFLFN